MAKSRKPTVKGGVSAPEHDDPASVAAYLTALAPPVKPLVEAIRAAALAAGPSITEGIKWNSVSFYRNGWFATINVRPRGGVQVVLHLGATARPDAAIAQSMRDPEGILKWMSADRAIVAISSGDEFEAKRRAFVDVVRQWAEYQAQPADES